MFKDETWSPPCKFLTLECRRRNLGEARMNNQNIQKQKSLGFISAMTVSALISIGCQRNNSSPSPEAMTSDAHTNSLASDTINLESETANYSDELIQDMSRTSTITNPGSAVTLTGTQDYSGNNTSYLDERNWGRDFRFTLPGSVQVTAGQPGNNWIKFTMKEKNAPSIVCVYRGNGIASSTTNGCSVSNGNSYQLDYCISEEIFQSQQCNVDIDNCVSHPNKESISALDTVAATEVSLNLVSGDTCSSTSVSMNLNNIQQTNASLSCGDVITDDSQLVGSTLDCRSHRGPGLIIATTNKTVDGEGFKILTGSQVSTGILATGEGLKIRAFEVEGDTNNRDRTIGILMFDSKNGEIRENITTALSMGIDYYGKIQNLSQIRIRQNIISSIKNFGVRLHVEDGITLNDPEINDNIFGSIDQFALRVKTSRYTLRGSNNNQLSNVRQYAYLSHGDLQVDGLDIRGMNLTAQALFVAEANSISVQNSNLTTVRSDYGVGLHIYNTKQVYVNNVTSSSGDVAVKLMVDRADVNTSLSVQNANLNGQRTAGIMVQTNGSGQFSQIQVQNSNLTNNPAGYAIWAVRGLSGAQPSVQNTQM